ncbi:aminotransferase class V-fold PLP-dependent enzyme [Pendulispora brunnea]|uniref:Aminotransferase class V-fold PLP-dependent enzyme n=2 Tax=Pendulispora brunnea TaxID=2905690 RepID=A0ABZ2KH72_9BACT
MRMAAESSWGQPLSLHAAGARARYALDHARQEVSTYVGAMPHEIAFVGSGREALARAFDLAIGQIGDGGTIVSSHLEHPSVLAMVEEASRAGHPVHWLALPGGVPNGDDVLALEKASLVALSMCNHELGTFLDVAALAPNAVRLVDAVQSAPWISLDSLNDDKTFYALSGSKLGAPMSVGVLRVPTKIYYAERERGSSIEGDSPPWLTAVGLGAVCAVRGPRRADALRRAREACDRLRAGLLEVDANLLVNGDEKARLGTILNVSFPGVFGKSLVSALSLEGICISHTAACQSRRSDVSPVVRVAYPDVPERAQGATRWSVSEDVTEDDIACAIRTTREILRTERRDAP